MLWNKIYKRNKKMTKYKYYVYLVNKNRLFISEYQFNKNNFEQLLFLEHSNEKQAYQGCKIFCQGIIIGQNLENKILNDQNEFLF